MAELAIISAVAAVAGSGLAATGHMMAGREQAQAAEFEQQQLNTQAEQLKIAAAQDEARRRDQLTGSLETIQALRAGRGVGSASPTGMAIFDSTVSNAETDINTSRLNILSRADSATMQATMAGRRGATSLLAGNLQAGADIFGGVSQGARVMAYPTSRSSAY